MTDVPMMDGNPISGQAPGAALPLPNALPPQATDTTTQPAQPQTPPPGSFASRLAQAADSLGVPTTMAQPGGWAKVLVGANLHALQSTPLAGTAQPAAQPSGQGVAPTAPTSAAPAQVGGWRGALDRVGNVAGKVLNTAGNIATGGMLSAEENLAQRQAAQRAETTIRVVANQRAMYRQDEADRLAAHTRDAAYMTGLENEGFETKKNVTQSQLNDMAKKDPNFFSNWRGRAVSEEPVIDGNGKPVLDPKTKLQVYSPIYTLASTKSPYGGEMVPHEITDQESAEAEKYLGVKLPAGTKVNHDQLDTMNVQIATKVNGENAINKVRETALTDAQRRQVDTDIASPNILHYLTMYPESALKGLDEAQKNGTAHIAAVDQQIANVQKVPVAPGQPNPVLGKLQQQRQQMVDEQGKISHLIQYGFDQKARDDYQGQIDKAQTEKDRAEKDKAAKDPLLKLETDPAEMTGDKAPAAQAMLQNMLNNPDTDPAQLPRIQRLIKQAGKAADNYQSFKQTEAENKEKIADGTPEDLAQGLFEGLIAPNQILSSRKPAFAQQAFKAAQDYAKAHGQNDWSAAGADAQFKYAQNPATQNTLNMISSMTSPGGSIDIVNSTLDKFPKVPVKVLNQVFNPLATQFGSQDVTDFHVAMLGLADEFSKIMGAGGGSDLARQQALDILKDSYSKGQLRSGVEILRREVEARGSKTVRNNPTLMRMYPELVPPPTAPKQNTGTPPPPAAPQAKAPTGTIDITAPTDTWGSQFGVTPRK